MKDYLATTALLDRNIGRTLDYPDKNNLDNNNIVIYVSNQGFTCESMAGLINALCMKSLSALR